MRGMKTILVAALAVSLGACKISVDGLHKGKSTSPSSSSGSSEATSEDERAEERQRRWADHDAEKAQRAQVVAAGRLKLNELVVIEPANGVPKVPPMRPSWCDAVPRKRIPSAGSLVEASIVPIRDRGWEAADHFKVAAGLCASPDDPDYQVQTGYVLQGWVNATGGTVKDGVAYLTLVVNPEGGTDAKGGRP